MNQQLLLHLEEELLNVKNQLNNKKFLVSSKNGSYVEIKQYSVADVGVDGTYYVHKTINEDSYTVSEATSGFMISQGDNAGIAVGKARGKLQKYVSENGIDALHRIIEQARANMPLEEVEKEPKSKVVEIDHFKPIVAVKQEEKPTTIEQALTNSIDYRNKIDLQYISEMLGITVEDIEEYINEHKLAFTNPESNEIEPDEQYLSGNVREKLVVAEFASQNNPKYERNVEALKKIIPETIPSDLIQYSIGAAWIPLKVFEKFAHGMFKCNVYVVYTKSTGKFSASIRVPQTIQIKSSYSAGGKNGLEIFNATLNNQQLVITETVDGKSSKNVEKTSAAQSMQEQMQDEFTAFIRSDEEIQAETEKIYNDIFNSHVDRKYAEPLIDYYPGASTNKKLRRHQKLAVQRAMNESTLFAHSVGSGKTLTAITTAMELRRLGKANKVMIVVQNKTRGQFLEEFRSQYPNAIILAPTAEDLTALRKPYFYERIANEDFDAVIIQQSQFDLIPDEIERQMDMLETQLELATDTMQRISRVTAPFEYSQARRVVRMAEKELSDLREEREKRHYMEREASQQEGYKRLLTFEQMNVDALLIDECFPYQTPILTTKGFIEIGEIVEKEMDVEVLSYNKETGVYEPKRVVNWFPKTLNNKLVKITHERGSFVCTGNHKIWTDVGYVQAKDLTNERTITYINLPEVRTGSEKGRDEILLSQMLCGNYARKPEAIPDLRVVPTEQRKKTRKQMLQQKMLNCAEIQRRENRWAKKGFITESQSKNFHGVKAEKNIDYSEGMSLVQKRCIQKAKKSNKQILLQGMREKRKTTEQRSSEFFREGKRHNAPSNMRMVQNITSKAQKKKILFKKVFVVVQKSVARNKRAKYSAWKEGISCMLYREKISWEKISSSERSDSNNKEKEGSHDEQNIFEQRREWATNETPNSFTRSSRCTEVLDGMDNSNPTSLGSVQVPAKPLQGGHWYSSSENIYRGGRGFTQNEEMEILRSQENGNIECVRVESCEVYEQGDRCGFGLSSKESDRVYDIEVEDNHNYFAAGVLVSNCERYKRLGFNTSLSQIKGIDPAKSKRSQSCFLKMRWVQQNNGGKNTHTYTGTPITNTMAEVWTQIRYVRPDVLVELGIEHFDQFAKTFGQIVPSLEMTGGGTFKIQNRFAKFQNLPELVSAFRKCADIVQKEDIQEFINTNDIPKMFHGKIDQVVVERSPELVEQINEFRELLEWYDQLEGMEKRLKNWIPLVVFNRAKQAAIDLRLLDPTKGDSTSSKVNIAIRRAFAIYKETGRVQMMFCDLYQSPEPKSEWLDDDCTIPNPAYGVPRFNLFNEIKSKLVELGVKPQEIAILTEPKYDKIERLSQLFEDANSGKVKFLLGTTERMGVGVNAQRLLFALHMLDAPQRPRDFAQRRGRIERQGNLNEWFWLICYGTEKTLDSAAFQRLAIKQGFIDQIMKGENLERVMDDAGDDALVTFEEMMALLSDSPFAQQKLLVGNKLKSERLKKDNFFGKQVQIQRNLNYANEKIERLGIDYDVQIKHLEVVQYKFPEKKVTNMIVSGLEHTEEFSVHADEYIDNLIKLQSESPSGMASGFITVNGTKVILKVVDTERWSSKHKMMYKHPSLYYTIPEIGIHESIHGHGILVESNSGSGLMTSIRWKVSDAYDKPESTMREIKNQHVIIAELEKGLDGVFDDTKLEALEKEMEILAQKMLEERIRPEIVQEILEID